MMNDDAVEPIFPPLSVACLATQDGVVSILTDSFFVGAPYVAAALSHNGADGIDRHLVVARLLSLVGVTLHDGREVQVRSWSLRIFFFFGGGEIDV